ncbi:MAG TPA: hypothetical protein VGD50_01860 [Candidatus Baltobacteraceae bacterium]
MPTSKPTPTATPTSGPPTNAPVSWRGDFTGFPDGAWAGSWDAEVSQLFAGTGPVQDATLPGGGDALDVHYAAHSSGFSCSDCGGAQGGIEFEALSLPSIPLNANALYLEYYIKFPVGFDWGLEGKLPGLQGANGWEARVEWHSATGTTHCPGATCGGGVLIDNACTGSELPVGRGSWTFAADGQWHSVQEYVNTNGSGTVTLWYDGKQAVTTNLECSNNQPVNALFFQSFYGGDSAKYGPSKATDIYFGGVQTSTAMIAPTPALLP